MIPIWKLKREVTRLGVQLKGIPQFFYEPILQYNHDRWRKTSLKASNGGIEQNENIALLLLYQPNGIADSVLWTCDHLIENGFAPLIISNSPLTEQDIEKIQTRCWKFVERPNFGYDFGGYRDGIWLLDQLKIIPKNLLILNDSVWFPIFDKSDLLNEMQNCPADYVGTQVFGRPQHKKNTRKWAQPFFGSYCFMIKKNAFTNNAFRKFWTEYKLTSNKEKTLHRGERAFSYLMFSEGIKSQGIFSRNKFDTAISHMSAEELFVALTYLVCLAPDLIARREALLSVTNHGPEWEVSVSELIESASESKNYIGSSPVVSINNLKFPMIKKNNERLYSHARAAITDASGAGHLPSLNKIVLNEIKCRNDQR